MNRWAAAARLIGIGFYIAACILLGILGGLWLDNRFDKSPLFVVAGLLLGLALAGYGVYSMIRPLMDNRRDKEHS